MKKHSEFENLQINEEVILSIPGFEIYPDKRKIYHDHQEINLTAKEYGIFILLITNRGRVLTYQQIYQNVWNEDTLGNENNAVGCHIRNLRRKIYEAMPDAPIVIRCIREIGYCLDFESK